MQQESFWQIIVSLVSCFLTTTFMMFWVSGSPSKPDQQANSHHLKNPTYVLIVGFVAFLLCAGAAIGSRLYRVETGSWWTTLFFVAWALVGLWVIVDYFKVRYEVTEDGLRYGKLIGDSRSLKWSELCSVKYSQNMKWFRLETESGEVVRLSASLIGLSEFARQLLAHAPASAIGKLERQILEATVSGQPPRLL